MIEYARQNSNCTGRGLYIKYCNNRLKFCHGCHFQALSVISKLTGVLKNTLVLPVLRYKTIFSFSLNYEVNEYYRLIQQGEMFMSPSDWAHKTTHLFRFIYSRAHTQTHTHTHTHTKRLTLYRLFITQYVLLRYCSLIEMWN